MKTKTADLTAAALDWAVAKCESRVNVGVYGGPVVIDHKLHLHYCGVVLDCAFTPSTDWAQGGPIIEREKISVDFHYKPLSKAIWVAEITGTGLRSRGSTALIAAMRCYVRFRMSGTVNVLDSLL